MTGRRVASSSVRAIRAPSERSRQSALVGALLLLAGADATATEAARAIADGTGVLVEVPAAPRRIVALAPDLAETLADLGAEASLVGACSECDRPAAVARLPKVGPMVSPSLEAVLALEPDLVVATSQGNPHDLIARLRALGVTVFGVDAARRGFDGVLAQVRLLGRLAGRDGEAEAIAGELERSRDEARRRAAGRPRVRACVLVWTDPPIAAGRGSFVEDVLEAAGADNACRRGETEYPRLSREDLLLAAPDVLLVATGAAPAGAPADLGDWAEGLPAVRAGRAVHADPDLLLRPTRRLALAFGVVESLVGGGARSADAP